MKTIKIKDAKQMEEIIQSCDICYVGMVDLENRPYVIPMNFGYVEGFFYLHSGNEGKKLECLEKNPFISISLCTDRKLAYVNKEVACSYTMKSKSIVAQCKVEFIENLEEKEKILNTFMQHYSKLSFKYSLPALKNIKIWKAKVLEMDCKIFGAPHNNI